MAYSNKFVKGAIGWSQRKGFWPLIVIERARSDSPTTPVFAEVFGFEQESGSVYAQEVFLVQDELDALNWVAALGARRPYFNGQLFYLDSQGQRQTVTV